MQQVHEFGSAAAVGLAVRTLLLSAEADDPLIRRLAGLGGTVDHEAELYAAVSMLIDDPAGYGLLVVNCTGLGGAETGARAARMLRAAGVTVPLILIGDDFARQEFPEEREQPVCLRAPVSGLSLHIGFEHAMRDRLLWAAA